MRVDPDFDGGAAALTDLACSERKLESMRFAMGGLQALTDDELQAFSGMPLAPLGLEKFVLESAKLSMAADSMPFDVSTHQAAQTAVAAG